MCAMTDDLYERYKEALRTGHVAVLRGSLEEALAAYGLAAQIAPTRALPHTSLGGVHIRLGHLEEALAEFAAAVSRSPHDEGALLGQAEALASAGMRSDAAAALDHVAEIQEAAGRLPEAADTLRRAVELEEAPERIRRQRALIRQIRFSSGDHAAEQLLARALRLRDEPAADALRPAAGLAFMTSQVAIAAPTRSFMPEPAHREFEQEHVAAAASFLPDQVAESESQPERIVAAPVAGAPAAEPVAAELVAAQPLAAEPVAVAPEPEPVAVSAGGPVGEQSDGRPVVGVMAGVDSPPILAEPIGESEHQPSGDELLAAAEAAEIAGDATALHSLLLGTARAYAREGLFDAALDAAHRLLQRAPGDVDAHLVLVDLYVARSWEGLAADKLRLLGRIADLDGDEETRQRLCVAATRAFPQDPKLQNLSA